MTEAARNSRSPGRLRHRLRRLVSDAMERDTLRAFVVPGPDVARALGLDLEAAGMEISATPRHASMLVLVGETPESLRRSAAVAYSQIPRPRIAISVGAKNPSPFPEPDFSIPLEQKALERATAEARKRLAGKVLNPHKEEKHAGEERAEDSDGGHASREEPDEGDAIHEDLEDEKAHAGKDSDEGHTSHKEPKEHAGKSEEHAEKAETESSDGGRANHKDPEKHVEHESMNHAEMDHDHMDHGDMGFMSMVAMTEGTPRSSDGLQMEWVAAPFGPLFPGLPGGLALTLTLDGDTVAESVVSSAVGMPRFEGMSGSAETFAGWLASLDPFSPVAYRTLALRAFEDAAGIAPDERTTLARIGAMERERAASHLGWLAGFGYLTGHARLAERAGKLQLALLRAGGSGESDRLRASGASEISRLKIEVDKLVENLRRNPLLTRRLKGVGKIPGDAESDAEASGPVARARGASADARADDDDEGYRSLGFEAVVRGGGDALSRMRVRLAEVSHSLDLILAAGSISVPSDSFDYGLSGKGAATVETPRGKASLRLSLRGRGVSGLELHTPSTRHIELVESVAKERELADALVGVASLDISPWEVLH
ncbi:MAG: hypothetical protein ACR2N0_02705 [Rubrobacteraceae bacterium]